MPNYRMYITQRTGYELNSSHVLFFFFFLAKMINFIILYTRKNSVCAESSTQNDDIENTYIDLVLSYIEYTLSYIEYMSLEKNITFSCREILKTE